MEEFPYKRYYIGPDGLEKLIHLGFIYKPIYVSKNSLPNPTKNSKGIYRSPRDDKHYRLGILTKSDQKLNDLTDYFTEPCRVQCLNEKVGLTLYEYYQRHKLDLVETLDRQNKPLTFKNLNELIYKQIPHCTNYKITYILGILDYFKPKSWLDLSAGWGDRLISAILTKTADEIDFVYEAVDPNPCLHPYYQEIIQNLVPEKLRKNFKIHRMGAESFKPSRTYDLVYTSPPFFTFERYSHERAGETQSISSFSTLESWLQGFLFVTIDTSWKCLKEGGNYLLYIEDKPEYRFMDRVIQYISSKPKSKFEGYIYQIYRDDKYPGKDTYRKVLWFSRTRSTDVKHLATL
jgi:hypothetical protein